MINYICTVDVEAHRGYNPVSDLIYGIIDGKAYGLKLILGMFKRYEIKATFFVDFAEVNTWGKEVIQKVCEEIMAFGQDIQIHLHPEHFGDKTREELSQYNYEEQKYMIGECIKYYEDFVGKKPVAFRAGKFSANEDTLKALNYYGIRIDSSYVKNNNWSKLNKIFNSVNKVEKYGELYELPITMFKERFFNKVGTRFDKHYPLDLNAITKSELKEIILFHKSNQVRTLVSLMHSFSFIKRYGDDLNLKPNTYEVALFELFFQMIVEDQEIQSINMPEYLEKIENFVEESGETFIASFWKSFWGIFLRYQKASIRCKQFRKYFVAFYTLLIGGTSILIYLLWGVLK